MTGGIFDGFEDYRTPTSDDYRETLTDGMVVFDANVLLNLYRFNNTTRGDLIKVMESLGDSLWIPHQVMREFWRNRESVIDQLGETPKESLTKLDKARQDAEEAVRAWSNRIYLPEDDRDGLLAKLNGAFQAVRHTISQQASANAHRHDTNDDTIVATLDSILGSRTGRALPPEDHDAAVTEADRRITAKEPPGYLDKDKADQDERAGDYLVWKQLLLEAAERSCDVLLVTSDVKEDWWRRAKGQLRGPRLELMAEFRRCTGHRLLMITPSELIRRADTLTEVRVNPNSAEDIERVEQSPEGPLPFDVEREVLATIYRRIADEHNSVLLMEKSHRVFTEWIDDPSIGGVLLHYMPAEVARAWLREAIGRHTLSDIFGSGPHADLVPQRYQTADEIVGIVCGTGWHLQEGTHNTRQGHGLATNGTSTRYVCWGSESSLEDLLATAARQPDTTDTRPMIVIVQHTDVSDLEYCTAFAEKVGFDLGYVKFKLSPNPDYVG